MGGKLAAAFDLAMEPTWKPKMPPALSAGLTVLLESKGEKVGASLSWGVCRGRETERNPKEIVQWWQRALGSQLPGTCMAPHP